MANRSCQNSNHAHADQCRLPPNVNQGFYSYPSSRQKSKANQLFVAICRERTRRETLIECTGRCAKHCQSVECSCSGGVIENNVFCRGDFAQIVEFCIQNRADGRCQRRSESHFRTQLSRALPTATGLQLSRDQESNQTQTECVLHLVGSRDAVSFVCVVLVSFNEKQQVASHEIFVVKVRLQHF